ELGRLLLARAGGGVGGGSRIRAEAEDLVNVGAAAGGAGEAEEEVRRHRAVRGEDALPCNDRLVGAAVDAVGKTQQLVLRDLEAVENRGRRAAAHGGFVGDLGGPG